MGKRVTEDQDTIILNIEVPAGMRVEAAPSAGFNDTLILNLGPEPTSAAPAHPPAAYPPLAAPPLAALPPAALPPAYNDGARGHVHQPAWPTGGYPVYLSPTHGMPGHPHRSNGRAQNAMSLGITSLVLSFMPLVGTVSWVLAPVALSKSSRALVEAEVTGAGQSEAVSGIVTSLTSLLICLAWVYRLWP